MRFHKSSHVRLSLSLAFALLMALASSQVGLAQIPIQSVTWDQPIRVPSPEDTNSWFPDLAVDSQGSVHIVWSESPTLAQSKTQTLTGTNPVNESVYYSTWNGNTWTQYVDIVAPSPAIRRSALAIDGHDTLHLLYGGSDPGQSLRLAYKSAEAAQAYSSANWSQPVYLNDQGQSYMSDIAVQQNTIHILYEDTGQPSGACSGCADIYYRSSPDLGKTWSVPVSLDPTLSGSARPHLFIDQNGVIYASWDEGFDQLSGKGAPDSGVVMISRDGGASWSNPLDLSYPDHTNVQTTVAAKGNGEVMVVWRTTDPAYPGIYYISSSDGGSSWSLPETLTNFQANPFSDPNDGYDMGVDSAGHIHLLASGYQIGTGRVTTPTEQPGAPGLYEFEWDGKNWYPPNQLYRGGWLPEHPRLVIDHGNQLYATWYLRENAPDSTTPYQIMYAHGQASSPRTEPDPLPAIEPTSTRVSSDLIALPAITSTPLEPTPTWIASTPASSAGLYSEWQNYGLILLSLIPVAVLIVGAAIAARRRGL